jgi:hypothetical protein
LPSAVCKSTTLLGLSVDKPSRLDMCLKHWRPNKWTELSPAAPDVLGGKPTFRHLFFICIFPKYIPTIATDNLYLFYSVCSLHVSAPTGYPQANHNTIYIFMKTIIPQHIRYFTIIHLYGVRLLLSIYLFYNHIMIIV